MDPSTTQARVVVDEWVRHGVTDVVACPGSRNAPFLLAVHAADAAGRLRLHVRADERSAGFLAVGLAAESGRVVPAITTSGTAVANLHPAVLEAHHGGVPLLVVSTDRPPELVGTGANQTVDQVGLFGDAVRATVVLAVAADGPDAADRPDAAVWRAAVSRALDRAVGPDPGPVQLDVPLREPLVPPTADEPLPAAAAGRPDGAPWTRVAARHVAPDPVPLDPALPTLVVAGHGAHAPRGLPDGIPVLAEPTSPLWGRGTPGSPWMLDAALDADPGSAAAGLRPRQVLVLGRPTLHRSVSRLLAHPDVAVHAVPEAVGDRARPGWTDVAGRVRTVGAAPDPADFPPAVGWARAWARAAAAAAAAVATELDGTAWATGPAVAAAVAAALPAGAVLVPGSSNPVRDLALAARPRDDVRTVAARGVAGIDGAVSFASGVALAHGGPAYALLGDLTFLHDTNGLLLGPDEPRPDLTVVVAHDDGGSIFAGLEPGAPAHAAAFERVFAVPHGTDLAALCRAHGVAHTRPSTADELAAALAPAPGLRVVEVRVDRADRRALGSRLAARAAAAVAQILEAPGGHAPAR